MSEILPQAFYARETLEVAADLIGKLLRHGPVTLRITEVEAYRFPNDTANHCRFGVTPRNAPMWGAPGHAYVYLCYGMHHLVNLVTEDEGRGAAVLVRACEPVEGLDHIKVRRGDRDGPVLLTGPGKVASALALDTRFSGSSLCVPGQLEVHDAAPIRQLLAGPRVGVDYAEPGHRDAPWRLAMPGTRWVSQRATLHPIEQPLRSFLRAQKLPVENVDDAAVRLQRAVRSRRKPASAPATRPRTRS